MQSHAPVAPLSAGDRAEVVVARLLILDRPGFPGYTNAHLLQPLALPARTITSATGPLWSLPTSCLPKTLVRQPIYPRKRLKWAASVIKWRRLQLLVLADLIAARAFSHQSQPHKIDALVRYSSTPIVCAALRAGQLLRRHAL